MCPELGVSVGVPSDTRIPFGTKNDFFPGRVAGGDFALLPDAMASGILLRFLGPPPGGCVSALGRGPRSTGEPTAASAAVSGSGAGGATASVGGGKAAFPASVFVSVFVPLFRPVDANTLMKLRRSSIFSSRGFDRFPSTWS